MPGMPAPVTDERDLTHEQDARVSALYHARNVLEKRGTGGTTMSPSPTDLLLVAEWIIRGEWLE